MANEIKLPNLGEGIDNASVLSVLVTEGQAVTKDDPIIEIESDKATLEVPAGSDGTVSRLLVKAGDTVSIGQAIITIEDADDTGPPQQEDSSQTNEKEPAPPAPTVKFNVSFTCISDGWYLCLQYAPPPPPPPPWYAVGPLPL